jgi:glutaredoxin
MGARSFGADGANGPVIHVYIFASKGCPECEQLKRGLGDLARELRCDIRQHDYYVDDVAEYKRLLAMEKRFGQSGGDMPVVFVDKHVLGADKLEKELVTLLRELASSGGAPELPVPSLEEAEQELRFQPPGAEGSAPLVHFEQLGCRACARAERVIGLASTQYPGLVIRRFSASTREGRLLLEAYCERAHVSQKRRLVVPALFVGDQCLIKEQITDESLHQLLGVCGAQGGNGAPQITEAELAAARDRLIARFGTVSALSVIVGGLIDSINPCAFATLVFLINYLAAVGRKGRDVLIVGGAFAAGVFVAYFAIGLGLSEALLQLQALPLISAGLTWCIICLTFVLAVISLYDFAQALRGKTDEVVLRLPHSIRMRINHLITRKLRTRSLALAALVLGLAVSLLELVCTGQVYLPLIQFMDSVSVDRTRTVCLLGLYNLAFVAPLIAIMLAGSLGMGSERLTRMAKEHVAPAKLAMAAFFATLGGLLLYFG